MAKKKSRVTPPIISSPKFVDYEDLCNGDTFLHGGCLVMKCENEEQEAINLDTGQMYSDMCDVRVEPVDIQITWKKK